MGKAFQAGYTAKMRGASRMSNPYHLPGMNRQENDWERGYLKAQADLEKAWSLTATLTVINTKSLN